MVVDAASVLPSSPAKGRVGAAADPVASLAAERRMEALNRLRRWMKPFEHVGMLGFFVFTAAGFLLLLFFFYSSHGAELAYRTVADFYGGGGISVGREWRLGVVGGSGECDLFEGEWVWDEMYPLYNSKDCPFIDLGFRCSENGRPDDFYAKWRWQPSRCDLPRFDAKKMLEKLRGRRLVFVGDSIGRNQWESLLCMLSSVVPDKSSIQELNGNPITKHMGFLVFKFKDYNCTVEYFRSPFLVAQGHAPTGAPNKIKSILRVDTIEWTSNLWRDADVLIFNSGHWWNYEKTIRGGCYFQIGNEVKMDMAVDTAYQISIKTFIDWISKEVNTSSTQVIFRTYSPAHFSGGERKNRGSCQRETVPILGNSKVSPKEWSHFLKPFRSINSAHSSNKTIVPVIKLLNITKMTAQRKDAHSSLFYLGPSVRVPLHKQDCSHWCLPGVPDAWNELLYSLFMRHQSWAHENLTHLNIDSETSPIQ